jgi:hypothetical protein
MIETKPAVLLYEILEDERSLERDLYKHERAHTLADIRQMRAHLAVLERHVLREGDEQRGDCC